MAASTIPLLRALLPGSRTAAEVAAATGRTRASVQASLSAMAATAGRGRDPLVSSGRGRDGHRHVSFYFLTDAGRAALAKVDAPPAALSLPDVGAGLTLADRGRR